MLTMLVLFLVICVFLGGTNASTTGNVTGVYDMSGGAGEYVMGVLSDSSGNPRSGYDSHYNSGFTGLLSDDTTYTGLSFPVNKYYDLYLSTQFAGGQVTNMGLCTLETCGGYALNEVFGWYNDYVYFVDSDSPWFVRGDGVGVFDSLLADGYGDTGNYSWRSVLVASDGA